MEEEGSVWDDYAVVAATLGQAAAIFRRDTTTQPRRSISRTATNAACVFSNECTPFVGHFDSLCVNLQSALGCVECFYCCSSECQVVEHVSYGKLE